VGEFSGCLCSLCTQQDGRAFVFAQGNAPRAEFQGRNDPLQEAYPVLGLEQPGVALIENQALESDFSKELAVPSSEGSAHLTAWVGDSE
jgi:hypothetical protein